MTEIFHQHSRPRHHLSPCMGGPGADRQRQSIANRVPLQSHQRKWVKRLRTPHITRPPRRKPTRYHQASRLSICPVTTPIPLLCGPTRGAYQRGWNAVKMRAKAMATMRPTYLELRWLLRFRARSIPPMYPAFLKIKKASRTEPRLKMRNRPNASAILYHCIAVTPELMARIMVRLSWVRSCQGQAERDMQDVPGSSIITRIQRMKW